MSGSGYRAHPSDGKEILRVLESSAAAGRVEVVYSRRPDAYESYMKESGEAHVFVARDGNAITGTCAELVREVYIGGEVCRAAYLCGLKKDAEYRGRIGFGPEFVRELRKDDIDYYYCSVLSENADIRSSFEKCSSLISMRRIADCHTCVVNPKARIRIPSHNFTFRRARGSDTERLLAFLNAEGRKKDMFPVIRNLDAFYGLAVEDFYMLLDGETILAAAALWDQTAYKQYIVKRYGGWMKLARLCNPLFAAMRYCRLPKENEPIAFPVLSFCVCRGDESNLFTILLHEMMQITAKRYGMLVFSLTEDHFAWPVMNGIRCIRLESTLYELNFPWSKQKNRSLDPKHLSLECGWL
ncbi:MAG: hypothetical protein J6023_01965 [Clostridia bacterium]|nr:hypothetical protein [Clostridia bacterium]